MNYYKNKLQLIKIHRTTQIYAQMANFQAIKSNIVSKEYKMTATLPIRAPLVVWYTRQYFSPLTRGETWHAQRMVTLHALIW